jgi:hypothetical protein
MRYAVFVLVLLLAGCSQEQLLQKFASPDDQAIARAYIDELRARDFDDLERAADPSIKGPTLRSTLAQMADLIPPGDPTSVKLVGAQSYYSPGAATVKTTFEYNFGEKWLLAYVAIKNRNDVKTIVGFHVYPEALALERQNAFTLAGKPAIAYIVLCATLVAPLFTVYALVLCIRTRLRGRRKWLWILFIVIGFGKFAVNWTTGQWSISPAYVQLFSASAFAPIYGPWTIAASVPLGAIMFLLRRKSLSAPARVDG